VSGSNRFTISVYRAPVTGSGSLTLGFTAGGASCGMVAIDEFSGIATTTPVDVSATSSATSATESTALTTTGTNDMILMYSTEVSTANFTYTQNATNIFNNSLGAGDFTGEAQYQVTTAAGAHTLTAGTGNSWPWFAVGVAYKA
jgi:hypothetical protein